MQGYTRPKPFINVLGKPMLLWVLDNLCIGPSDELVIVYDPSFLKAKYWPLITDKYPNLRRVELAGPTRGAAETVLLGLKALPAKDRKRPVMLCDGDTFYTADIVSTYRAAAANGHNAVFYFDDFDPKPIYSYITISPNTGLIADVKEKVKISDHANSGCYCFASGTALLAECDKLLASGSTQLSQDQVGEYYTSGVIKRMLDAGEPFAPLRLQTADFHVLGTPAQVQGFCTSWPEVSKMRFCFDLDNTLVTSPRMPGDYTTCLPMPENIELVRELKEQGHYIIITSSRRMRSHKGNVNAVVADIGATTLTQLKEFDIPHDEIVFGKPWAQFYVDDLTVDALGDVSKQTGFYFPTSVKVASKPTATMTGTTETRERPRNPPSAAMIGGAFLTGALAALALVTLATAARK